MEVLHLPDNVKVHFAGGEVQNQYIAAKALGVNYALYTCYPWVERKIFPTAKSPIMPLRWQKEGDTGVLIPQYIAQTTKHTIQDSGLFTLMFGSQKEAKKDKALINRWYDGLVEFTLSHGQPVTCVEVDCQKLLGPSEAWEFQERLVSDIVDDIMAALGEEYPPLGVALIMQGEHLCKTMRGARKPGKMSTCRLDGIFKDNPAARNEFLSTAAELLK